MKTINNEKQALEMTVETCIEIIRRFMGIMFITNPELWVLNFLTTTGVTLKGKFIATKNAFNIMYRGKDHEIVKAFRGIFEAIYVEEDFEKAETLLNEFIKKYQPCMKEENQ